MPNKKHYLLRRSPTSSALVAVAPAEATNEYAEADRYRGQHQMHYPKRGRMIVDHKVLDRHSPNKERPGARHDEHPSDAATHSELIGRRG